MAAAGRWARARTAHAVMTTTIALETSKGNLALALALGLILVTLAVLVNAAVMGLRRTAVRAAYA